MIIETNKGKKRIGLLILDRDGVINENSSDLDSNLYYILCPKDFIFKDGVLDAFRDMWGLDCDICICTRQRCISKGLITLKEIEQIHVFMRAKIDEQGGRKVDKIYIEPKLKSKQKILKQASFDFGCCYSNMLFLDDNLDTLYEAAEFGINGVHITEKNNLLKVISDISQGIPIKIIDSKSIQMEIQ